MQQRLHSAAPSPRIAVTIGEELPVGEYTLKVTVTDTWPEPSSFEKKFTCKETEFALVAARFSSIRKARCRQRLACRESDAVLRTPGIWLRPEHGRADLEMTIEIFDDKGKLTMPKPIRSVVHNEDRKVVAPSANFRRTDAKSAGSLCKDRPHRQDNQEDRKVRIAWLRIRERPTDAADSHLPPGHEWDGDSADCPSAAESRSQLLGSTINDELPPPPRSSHCVHGPGQPARHNQLAAGHSRIRVAQ